MTTLRLGTRKSRLALVQSESMAEAIMKRAPGVRVELVPIVTQGDRDQKTPLPEIGGKGLFTKELEDGLLEGRIDLAVHSLKDLPTELPAGLALGAVPPRETPLDALLTREAASLAALPPAARVATSSLRRQAQLRLVRPDLALEEIRGNVDTRVRKLRDGGLDALVLAAAGLRRLGLEHEIREILPADVMTPAVGQGALAIEIRDGDSHTGSIIGLLDDADTRASVTAERAFLGRLGGGCRTPIGALAHVVAGELRIHGVVAAPDGSASVRGERAGRAADAASIGASLADDFLARGAAVLLSGGAR